MNNVVNVSSNVIRQRKTIPPTEPHRRLKHLRNARTFLVVPCLKARLKNAGPLTPSTLPGLLATLARPCRNRWTTLLKFSAMTVRQLLCKCSIGKLSRKLNAVVTKLVIGRYI